MIQANFSTETEQTGNLPTEIPKIPNKLACHRIFWSNSSGSYKVRFEEQNGDVTCAYSLEEIFKDPQFLARIEERAIIPLKSFYKMEQMGKQ